MLKQALLIHFLQANKWKIFITIYKAEKKHCLVKPHNFSMSFRYTESNFRGIFMYSFKGACRQAVKSSDKC